MATILKNILRFTNGGPTVLPHGLNVNDVPALPQFVAANVDGFTLTVTATTVTISPTGNVDVYVERWHTIEDVEPVGGLGNKVPFIVAGAAGGGGGDFAMAFIGNSEGATIISQVNVATVSFDGTVTTLTLTAPVPDTDKAILTVTLFAPSNGPNGVYAQMTDASTVQITIQDVAANPTFTAFFFRLALVP